jgi:hypothetical protein
MSETHVNSAQEFLISYSKGWGSLHKLSTAGARECVLPGRGPNQARLSQLLFIPFLFLFLPGLGNS